MAVSADGSQVYAAIFESGNGTTLVSGGAVGLFGEPPFPQGATDPENPYGGVSPAPNNGTEFNPPLKPNLPPPPPVGVIVQKYGDRKWRDDNGADWTEFVSGSKADKSARVPGWDLLDHDLMIIDADSLETRYIDRLMNLNMALAVHPTNGTVTVVGTEATNVVRFEPVLNGVFLRVNMALVDVDQGTSRILDLNPHLDYKTRRIPISKRRRSIGDPRAVTWDRKGEVAFVAGMGSDSIIAMRANGKRDGGQGVIPVGEGPTGLVIDPKRDRLYVLNKFDASISAVDTRSRIEVKRVPLFDPTPRRSRRAGSICTTRSRIPVWVMSPAVPAMWTPGWTVWPGIWATPPVRWNPSNSRTWVSAIPCWVPYSSRNITP